MAGGGADTSCGVLKESLLQSMRGLLELLADAKLFEAAHLAASCLVSRGAGDEALATGEGCRAIEVLF